MAADWINQSEIVVDELNDNTNNDIIIGTDGNDILIDTAGWDHLYGGIGSDIFVFEVVSAFDGLSTIEDFSVAEGDIVDLTDLLTNYDPVSDAITDFIQITDGGTHSTLAVDSDGAANGQAFVDVVQFDHVTGLTDEEQLVSDGRLLI